MPSNMFYITSIILGSSDGEFGIVKYTLKKQTHTSREDRDVKVSQTCACRVLDKMHR